VPSTISLSNVVTRRLAIGAICRVACFFNTDGKRTYNPHTRLSYNFCRKQIGSLIKDGNQQRRAVPRRRRVGSGSWIGGGGCGLLPSEASLFPQSKWLLEDRA
jgi:hypothetical protein